MKDDSLRLISWNIGGRVKANRKQTQAIKSRAPDVVALQEVRLNALKQFQRLLPELDLSHIVESAHLADQHDRVYGELIASRWPVQHIPGISARTTFPERALSANIDSPWGDIEIHTVHVVPGSSCGWKKIEMFEEIYCRLSHSSEIPRILCGDFNSPQFETPDGRVVTWGQRAGQDGEILIKDGRERWDAGERSVLEWLADYDLSDVFRRLNGHNVEAFSWSSKYQGKVVNRRRFDHVFASDDLNPVECRYLEQVAKLGLSDHTPIEATFRPRAM